MSRDYRYLPDAGLTLVADVDKNTVKLAASFCGPKDTYSKETGRQIVDLLLDANDNTLKALNLRRNVFTFKTDREDSGKDILKNLIAYLSGDEPPYNLEMNEVEESEFVIELIDYLTERKIHLFTLEAEERNIKNISQLREFGEYKKSDVFINLVEGMLDELEEDGQGKLNEVEDLQEIFFDWRGSTDAICNAIKKYAKLMHVRVKSNYGS